MRARCVVLAALVLSVLAAGCGEDDGPEFCTADGLGDPNGETYGRSVDAGCRFVDENGDVVEELSDGTRICYDDVVCV